VLEFYYIVILLRGIVNVQNRKEVTLGILGT
jgi:ribosomal protein L30/L7E